MGLSGNGFIKMNRVMGPPSGVKFPDRAALSLAGSAVKTVVHQHSKDSNVETLSDIKTWCV